MIKKPPRAYGADTGSTSAYRLCADALKKYLQDSSGSMILFGVLIFGLMLAIGGLSLDLMRYETHRVKLQSALDRAVLAAASRTQQRDRRQVIVDYLAKEGLDQYIDLADISITEGADTIRGEATARISVPLHHGLLSILSDKSRTTDVLVAEAHSVAVDSLPEIEISLVLDVSGSMGLHGRLPKLKESAKQFIDLVFKNTEPGKVAVSLIPFSTQVSVPPALLSKFQMEDTHDYSHCINFEPSDFQHTEIPLDKAFQQSLHFDYNISGSWRNQWGLKSPTYWFTCDPEASAEVLAWSTDPNLLKDHIDALAFYKETSPEIGMKWGAAFLDPSLRPIAKEMVSDGDLPPNVDGRPGEYNNAAITKILVVFTDGEPSEHRYIENLRSEPSFVWKFERPNEVYYSLWHDGEGSDPDTSLQLGHTSTPQMNWFVAYNDYTSGQSGYDNQYMWRASPYDGDEDEADDGIDAIRMSWAEVWAEVPPRFFSEEILSQMGTLTYEEKKRFWLGYVGGDLKQERFLGLCEAAKSKGVLIFTVGLEVKASFVPGLSSCASSTSHFYRAQVDNLDNAFQSIARHITRLRLVE